MLRTQHSRDRRLFSPFSFLCMALASLGGLELLHGTECRINDSCASRIGHGVESMAAITRFHPSGPYPFERVILGNPDTRVHTRITSDIGV